MTGLESGYCDVVYCDNLRTENNKQKCEGVTKSTFVVPLLASSITVQLRDGLFNGDFDCGSDGSRCCGVAGVNLCSLTGKSQVCQVTLDLSKCSAGATPVAVDCKDNCKDLPCAFRSCHGDICKVDEYTPGDTCRKKEDLCDKTEYCEGHSTAMCPQNLRRDNTPGYALRCGDKDIYLCGIPEKYIKPEKGHHTWFLEDRTKCSLGTNNKAHELDFPWCTKNCPLIDCGGNHVVEKYIVAKCDATIKDGNPWKCDSSHELTDDDYKQKTICPLNPHDYYH